MSQRRPGSTALRAIPICEYSIRRKRISCKFILEEASTQTLFWSVEKCRKNGELSAIERRAWIRNRKEKNRESSYAKAREQTVRGRSPVWPRTRGHLSVNVTSALASRPQGLPSPGALGCLAPLCTTNATPVHRWFADAQMPSGMPRSVAILHQSQLPV